MKSEKKLVPELRFKEFNNFWEENKISNLFELETGKETPLKKTILNKTTLRVYPIYSSKTKASGIVCYSETFLYEDCIVWSTRGENAGHVRFVTGKFNCTSNCGVFTNNKDFSNQAMSYLIQKNIKNCKTGSGQPMVTMSSIKNIKLKVPSIEEQGRISTFLTNVDKKIKLMEEIQQLKLKYKKGLLQGLFVGGGVLNVPSLRFKGFDKDWKTVKIADLFTFFKGKGVSKKDIANDGKNKVVLYGEINTTYNWKVNSVESKTNLNKENLVLSVGNQLLFPSSGYVPTTMVCPVSLNESGVIISGDTNILTPLKGYSDFLALVFQANKQELSKIVQGTTVRHLYNKDLSFGSIVITEELKEQKRIISFLFNTDKQIENCDLNLEFLRSWKVGLLQRMFV